MRVLMIGQFSLPVTGEFESNESIANYLRKEKYNVDCVDSSLIKDVNAVGKISLLKVLKLFNIYFMVFMSLFKRYDVVYLTPGQTAFGVLRFLPILLLFKLTHARCISHWHGYGLFNLSDNKVKFYIKLTLSLADNNILLTNDLRDKLLNLYGINISYQVVYNGVESSGSTCIDSNKDLPLNVLYMGSLMYEKGANLFIDAAKLLPEVNFFMCGSGELDIKNTALETDLLLSNFHYCGVVRGEDKATVLQNADIFVLQTDYTTEGVPLSMLEAMTYGCAIIITKHNGIPEVLKECGIWVDKSSLDLVQVISSLDSDRKLLDIYKNRAFNRSLLFSKKSFFKNIEDILNYNCPQ